MEDLSEYVKDGQINISRQDLKVLIGRGKKNLNAVADGVVALIDDGTLTFPYKSAFTSDKDIIDEFNELQSHEYKTINPSNLEIKRLDLKNPDLLKYQGQYVVVLYALDDYIRFGS
ncbi:MAG: hypothetical protein ACRC1D_03740, partial [Culicoidibacterales bacterium]